MESATLALRATCRPGDTVAIASPVHQRELMALPAQHDIPLIEDDVYGDLAFGPSRPAAVKAFDEKGLVLHCSPFSKTLAPGYRVGWIVPGRYQRKACPIYP